jgi:hypothetical protein
MVELSGLRNLIQSIGTMTPGVLHLIALCTALGRFVAYIGLTKANQTFHTWQLVIGTTSNSAVYLRAIDGVKA